jgi:flagellin-like hook-associated protein FlgL
MDVDVAAEVATLVASQIRQQAAAAVLAQANQGASIVLELIKNVT